MLYVSLFFSALLLLVANAIVPRQRYPFLMMLLIGAVFAVGPAFLMFASPSVAMQALFLTVAAIVWQISFRGRQVFLALSLVATFAAYGISISYALVEQRRFDALRARFPYVSVEE